MSENPHRVVADAAGAVDCNKQSEFTTPPQNDQQSHFAQSHFALHAAPVPGDPSGCMVAVTMCCKEAAELASKILPPTPAVFGRQWLYLVKGKAPTEKFLDPVSGKTLVETQDATAEFANIGALVIEIDKLRSAVARLSAHGLGSLHCEGVVAADDESLVCALDDLANPLVVDRIVFWLDYPAAGAVYDA